MQTAHVYSVQTYIARRVFGLKAAMERSHKSIMDLAIHDDRSLYIIQYTRQWATVTSLHCVQYHALSRSLMGPYISSGLYMST